MNSVGVDVIVLLSDRLIPKPPKDVGYSDVVLYACPTCSHIEYLFPDEYFCSVCGQAIDWVDLE